MSNMNAEERDKILDDFIKDSKKDLNETIAREKARLDDHINQYKTQIALEHLTSLQKRLWPHQEIGMFTLHGGVTRQVMMK